jgi:hypothetical protein
LVFWYYEIVEASPSTENVRLNADQVQQMAVEARRALSKSDLGRSISLDV